MPFEQWPEIDRNLWQRARTGGGMLDESGLAAHWSENTAKPVMAAYGRYLAFLQRTGALDPLANPSARTTPERIVAFVKELQATLAPVTVAGCLRDLSQVLRVMEPGCDRASLKKVVTRLARAAKASQDKASRLVEPALALEAGLAEMERVALAPAENEVIQATRVRDGLILALLAARPVRLSNLAALRLDHDMIKRDGAWWVDIRAEDNKTGQAQWMPLPAILTMPMDVYLSTYRPRLLRGSNDDHVWISLQSRHAMSSHTIYCNIVELTAHLFGHPVNPHLFRDSAMTALAIHAPGQVRAGARLLGHRSLATNERHYNHADQTTAVRLYHEALGDLLDAGDNEEDKP